MTLLLGLHRLRQTQASESQTSFLPVSRRLVRVQAVHNPFVARMPSQAEQDQMVSTWMSWAATCCRGTPEGKAQCLSLFTSLQKLHDVP